MGTFSLWRKTERKRMFAFKYHNLQLDFTTAKSKGNEGFTKEASAR